MHGQIHHRLRDGSGEFIDEFGFFPHGDLSHVRLPHQRLLGIMIYMYTRAGEHHAEIMYIQYIHVRKKKYLILIIHIQSQVILYPYR